MFTSEINNYFEGDFLSRGGLIKDLISEDTSFEIF
jgi:hypothetical protein